MAVGWAEPTDGSVGPPPQGLMETGGKGVTGGHGVGLTNAGVRVFCATWVALGLGVLAERSGGPGCQLGVKINWQ